MTARSPQRRERKLVQTNLLSFSLLTSYFGRLCGATGGTRLAWFCSLCTILLMYNTYVLRVKLFILADKHTQQWESRENNTSASELKRQVVWNEVDSLSYVIETTYVYVSNNICLSWRDLMSGLVWGHCVVIADQWWLGGRENRSHQSLTSGRKVTNL